MLPDLRLYSSNNRHKSSPVQFPHSCRSSSHLPDCFFRSAYSLPVCRRLIRSVPTGFLCYVPCDNPPVLLFCFRLYTRSCAYPKTPPHINFVGSPTTFRQLIKVAKSRGNPTKKLILGRLCLSEITPVVRVLFRTKSSSLSLKSISPDGETKWSHMRRLSSCAVITGCIFLARRQSYYAIPVSIMAGSTADRIDALRGLAVSVIARISAVVNVHH